jgi:restriction endonuclease Mrr
MEKHKRYKDDPTYNQLASKLESAEKIKDAWENDPFIPAEDADSYHKALHEYENALERFNQYIGEVDEEPNIEELFENKNETIRIIPTIIDINGKLKSYLAKHPEKLYDLSPRKFEELIADILKDFGFDVELTQATRDGGKDIYAYIKNQVTSFLTFVECKRWSPTKPVGIEIVQRLYGVQQINKANKGMIVTTSYFSRPAIEESKRYENLMDLNDYNDIKKWLNRYILTY